MVLKKHYGVVAASSLALYGVLRLGGLLPGSAFTLDIDGVCNGLRLVDPLSLLVPVLGVLSPFNLDLC